ncbi:MAG: retinol dehydrogenase 12 [Actinomycetota bacterium]|nr:retinol dehydrogenase 12 [Actinomycetota bacterium]
MSDPRATTIVITGANTGIGRATAAELASQGARVILACRSEDKTRPVIDDIVARTGNDSVEFLALDLADLASVRAAAATLLDRDDPIHVLINNAGVAGQRGETAQGFELAFGINHLGHFLFTDLLLDRLRASAPARVINVSSDSHYQPKAIDWDAVRRPTATVSGMREYGVSKLCNVLHAQELARRLADDGVVTASLHPGVIASDVWRRVPLPVRSVMKLFMKSTEEGARTSVHCATTTDLVSGAFYTDEREKAPSKVATPELAAELWERSEGWVAA